MRIVINVDTGNAAFADDYEGEMTQLIEQIQKQSRAFGVKSLKGKTFRDTNGNTVASVNVTGR